MGTRRGGASPRKADAVAAVRLAEAYIKAGLTPEDEKWKLIASFQTMRHATVVDRTRPAGERDSGQCLSTQGHRRKPTRDRNSQCNPGWSVQQGTCANTIALQRTIPRSTARCSSKSTDLQRGENNVPSNSGEPAQKRTLRPIYAQHQATPYGGFRSRVGQSFDILPALTCTGRVARSSLRTRAQATRSRFGLSALFIACPSGNWTKRQAPERISRPVWVGDSQVVFEVLAPAFDATANWTAANISDGGRRLRPATTTVCLTPTGANEGNAIAELRCPVH